MNKQLISSGSPYEPQIGFSRAVRLGSLIAVSGTAPIAADGSTEAPGDAYRQAVRCFRIMQQAVEQAGGRLEDIIRTRIYLTRRQDWPEVARAHGEFFSQVRPASTFVVVKELLDPDWLVETEAEAWLSSEG